MAEEHPLVACVLRVSTTMVSGTCKREFYIGTRALDTSTASFDVCARQQSIRRRIFGFAFAANECRDGTYHHLRRTSITVGLKRTVEAWSHIAFGKILRHDHVIFRFAFELSKKAKEEEVEKLCHGPFKLCVALISNNFAEPNARIGQFMGPRSLNNEAE